jgi:hypothetical protein
MAELKTLKDLISSPRGLYSEIEGFTSLNELKQTAKEWIEAIDNHRWDRDDKYLEEHPKLKEAIDGDYYHCQVINEWIKYFFNLENK